MNPTGCRNGNCQDISAVLPEVLRQDPRAIDMSKVPTTGVGKDAGYYPTGMSKGKPWDVMRELPPGSAAPITAQGYDPRNNHVVTGITDLNGGVSYIDGQRGGTVTQDWQKIFTGNSAVRLDTSPP